MLIEWDEDDKLRYESYRQGWMDGATGIPRQEHRQDSLEMYHYDEYDRGYIEGAAAAFFAFHCARERIGKPTAPS
jgi:hypothetical protein